MRGVLRTVRYARSWKGVPDTVVRETRIMREGRPIEATLVMPAGVSKATHAWVAIGGVSRMGRFHPQLMRFAGALASSGAAVLVPEVPEWRRLDVTPRVTAPTIRGAIDHLETLDDVDADRVGLIGFSFGAPQVAIAGSCPDLSRRIAGVVLFGGYCCLRRTLRCQLTGRHEWDGVEHALEPDPYGRWVVAANHLTDVPGYEDATDVAEGLFRLAAAASDRRIKAWEPYHDPMIREVRAGLPERKRPLFDQLATPSDEPRPDAAECEALADALAEACRRVEPLLEPMDRLGDVAVPTRLIHGRSDRLIPFTEGLRLSEGLAPAAGGDLTITGLFDHSADRLPPSLRERFGEQYRLFEAIRGLINTT